MNPSNETESFQIRNAFPSDADSIIAFNQAMAWETENRTLEDRIIRAGVQRIFDEPDQGFYLVAESEKRIIGTLMVTREWSDWRNGQFWWIQSVYVEKRYRRKGVTGNCTDSLKKWLHPSLTSADSGSMSKKIISSPSKPTAA